MTVAAGSIHRFNGFFIFRKGEGWEYVNMLAWVAFVIAWTGGGRYTLDQAVGIDFGDIWRPLIGLGGFAAGVGQLILFWRKPAPDPVKSMTFGPPIQDRKPRRCFPRLRGVGYSSRRPRRSTMASTRRMIRPLSTTGIRRLPVVTPTTAGDVTWDELAPRLPDLQDFASDALAGGLAPLGTLPETYSDTVRLSGSARLSTSSPPARYECRARSVCAIRFAVSERRSSGSDRQIRVEDEYLVVQDGDTARGRGDHNAIRQAARLAGIEYRPDLGTDLARPPGAERPRAPARNRPGRGRGVLGHSRLRILGPRADQGRGAEG